MKDYNAMFDEIISTDRGALTLLEILVTEYGPKDAVCCTFPYINDDDQRRFLDTATEMLCTCEG